MKPVVFLLHFILPALPWAAQAATSAASAKPNVLLIAIDDLNDWVGCLGGHPDARSPHIDRLAKRGVLFTNAHCQAPICNPSRASIMYGLRPSSSGIYDNAPTPWTVPALKQRVTLPRHFAAHGYRTLATGKIHHASGMPPGDFDVVGPLPGQPNKLDVRVIPPSPGGARGLWDFGPQTYDEKLFQDHADATWAIERIREKSEEPFFLAIGIYRPHVPLYAPARVFDEIPVAEIDLPLIRENDLDDIPPIAGKLIASPHGPPHDWFVKTDNWRKAVHAYLACVRFADEQVGRLLDALDASPHAENTIVILYSDHGFFLGEKEHWAKRALWERATRVPFIISAPGFRQGGSCARPAELQGIYPTLVELCDLTKRDDIDGHSLVPLLRNPQAEWNRPALTTHGQNNHAVRTERHRYIRYRDGSEELYDHQSDPHEWTNLSVLPEHAALKKELAEWFPITNVPPAVRGKPGGRGKSD